MYSRQLNGRDARLELAKGVEKLVDAVKVTLGGEGKNVAILDKTDHPHFTKDGVTVARNICLRNDVQQGGVNTVRQAAEKAAKESGDGTTSATILAGSLIKNGLNLVETEDIQKLKEGMDFAYSKIDEELSKLSFSNLTEEDVINIATISANGDRKIGEVVGKGVYGLGVDNTFKIESAEDLSGLTFEKIEGYNYEKTMTMHFENVPGTGKTILYNPRVLIINSYLGDKTKLLDVIEYSENNAVPVVLLYQDIDPNVLTSVVKAFNEKKLNLVAVQLPDYGELMELSSKDLAICTQSERILNINTTTPNEKHMGYLKYFEINGNEIKMLFFDEYKDLIKELSDNLKESCETAGEASYYLFKNRYDRTSTGAGLFKIGCATQAERKEIEDRVEDAIGSVKSAMKSGFVVGGGLALLAASDNIRDYKFDNNSFQKGFDLVTKSCSEPFLQILKNSGLLQDKINSIYEDVIKGDYKSGYNVKSKEFENFIEKGIIDATNVVKISLKSAISATIGILTTECVVYPEDNMIETEYSIG